MTNEERLKKERDRAETAKERLRKASERASKAAKRLELAENREVVRAARASGRAEDAHRKILAGGTLISAGLGDLVQNPGDENTAMLAGLLLHLADLRKKLSAEDRAMLLQRGIRHLSDAAARQKREATAKRGKG